jgi:hypothetical protein
LQKDRQLVALFRQITCALLNVFLQGVIEQSAFQGRFTYESDVGQQFGITFHERAKLRL